jgi:membrane-associated phospholipid phosphatase
MEKRLPDIFLLLAVFTIISLYVPINSYTNSSANVLSLPLDGRIPLIPLFVVPYLSFFLFLPWTLLSFMVTRNKLYREMCYSLMIASFVSYAIYMLYHTTIVRPHVTGLGIASRLVAFLYLVDPPFSCFPSLHSSLSTIAVVHWFRSASRVRYVVLTWGVLIIVSTVMIKQHHILDALGGIALGLLSSYGVARLFSRVLSRGSALIG